MQTADTGQADNRLSEGEERFRSLFDTLAQGVVYQDPQGAVIAANPAAERILGLTLAQMRGQAASDPRWHAIHEDGSAFPNHSHPYLAALRTGLPVTDVVMGVYVPAEDRFHWINVNAVPLFKPGETAPYQVYSIFEEITERKEFETRLQESEARFQALFENLPMQGAIYRLIRDDQADIVDWEISDINPLGAASIRGQAAELIGKRAVDLFGPEVMASYLQVSRQVAASGEPMLFETHFETNDRDYLSSVFMVGKYHYASISVDITDRKRAEKAALSRERQLQALVSSLDDIVFEVDERSTFVNVWAANDSLLFRPRAEVLGKRFDEVFGAEASRPFFEFLARTLTSDTPQTLEYPLEINGTQHWFAARFNPIHARQETRTTVSILVRDITTRKRAEALVYAQRDLARAIGAFATVEEGFRAILETALHVSSLDSGGIYLVSPDAQRLELIYHQGLGAAFVHAVGGYPIDAPNAQLALAGRPLYVSLADPALHHPVFAAEGLHSLAAVPILYQDRVIGCFNLASHTEAEVPHFARGALETLAVEVSNFVVHLQAQAALHASEERYRSLVEASDAIIVLLDADGRIHYINERAPAMQGAPGWRVEDVIGKTLHELPPPLADLYLPRVRQVIAADQSVLLESPAGPMVYRVSIQPIHDDQGKAVMALLSATDITALKQIQQELQELNRALEERVRQRTAEVQDLYDNAPTGYQSLDANGCFLRINQTELNWLGYTREELIGRPVTTVISPPSQAAFTSIFATFKQRGWMRDIEYDLVRRDGTTFPVLVNATAVYDDQGNYVASRSTLVDNTERKRAEQAVRESEETLRLANAELARALRIKDEFLANMSHELRTPLHGILAVTETLIDQIRGPLNERQQKSVRLIDESGRHLLALINDLLDLSRIEAGKLELHRTPISVDDTCRASLLFVRSIAAKKEIQVDYANDVPGAQLVADEQRLKQMLVNLLGNAVKFTPNGGHVHLVVTEDLDAGLIHFAVQDTGPGIPPADQARLFKPFIQVDSQLSRQYEGSGLGLALVKRLAEQHGGTVALASTGIPGEGCCFIITLPLAPAGGV